MSSDNIDTVYFVVGNTYKSIPPRLAKYDRSRNHRKIHDWICYVDVITGDPDVIERVTFDLGHTFQPQNFVCAYPVPSRRPNGRKAWRFCTRQQSYGFTTAKISIRGCGGTRLNVSHSIDLSPRSSHSKAEVHSFREDRGLRRLRPLRLPPLQQFGVELELTSALQLQPTSIANALSSYPTTNICVIESYSEGRLTSTDWKLVPDGSIMCSVSVPDCNKFELVSPILKGGDGLNRIDQILRRANTELYPKLKVNKSMGFHVHVDVSGYQLQHLIKICQNFIKYEAIMDTFMPPSRRTGSQEAEQYFQSNRDSVAGCISSFPSNKECHDAIGQCGDFDELARLMNYRGRYYKLNLQNLVTGRQSTIEFRQHSSTVNYEKVSHWVRFCILFTIHSAKLAPPSSFKDDRDLDFKFDALFNYVIKDRALRQFYRARRLDLSNSESEPCCTGCSRGSLCSRKR